MATALFAESIIVRAIASFARGEPGSWIGLAFVVALLTYSAYRTYRFWVSND